MNNRIEIGATHGMERLLDELALHFGDSSLIDLLKA